MTEREFFRELAIVDVPQPLESERCGVDLVRCIIRVSGTPVLYLTESQAKSLAKQFSRLNILDDEDEV